MRENLDNLCDFLDHIETLAIEAANKFRNKKANIAWYNNWTMDEVLNQFSEEKYYSQQSHRGRRSRGRRVPEEMLYDFNFLCYFDPEKDIFAIINDVRKSMLHILGLEVILIIADYYSTLEKALEGTSSFSWFKSDIQDDEEFHKELFKVVHEYRKTRLEEDHKRLIMEEKLSNEKSLYSIEDRMNIRVYVLSALLMNEEYYI